MSLLPDALKVARFLLRVHEGTDDCLGCGAGLPWLGGAAQHRPDCQLAEALAAARRILEDH